jgi:hypothetical protein
MNIIRIIVSFILGVTFGLWAYYFLIDMDLVQNHPHYLINSKTKNIEGYLNPSFTMKAKKGDLLTIFTIDSTSTNSSLKYYLTDAPTEFIVNSLNGAIVRKQILQIDENHSCLFK